MTLLTPERLAELEHYARLRTAPAPQDAEAIRALLAHIDALTARLAGLTKPVDDDIEETQYWRVVYRHAVRLLEALHPGLLKANTTIGIINQIDNITVGLARENAALKVERDAADAKEDDATHRAHNAEAKLAEAVAALASARSDTLEEAAREAERTWNSSGQPGFRLIGVGIANNIRAITAITKGEQP